MYRVCTCQEMWSSCTNRCWYLCMLNSAVYSTSTVAVSGVFRQRDLFHLAIVKEATKPAMDASYSPWLFPLLVSAG